jgi:dGTPase
MKTTKRMEWNKLLSTKRVRELTGKPSSQGLSNACRSEFGRDKDQIIFSYPFRRLQDKTQVIPFPKADFVHTRLTHSLEVSSIGNSLVCAVWERIKEEIEQADFHREDVTTLVEAACLAHDIGNPPFGHSGEDSISEFFNSNSPTTEKLIESFIGGVHNSWFDRIKECILNGKEIESPEEKFTAKISRDDAGTTVAFQVLKDGSITEKYSISVDNYKKWHDLTHFEGNANAFRIMVDACDDGLNPTLALLGTLAKYPRESYLRSLPEDFKKQKGMSKYGFFQSEKETFREVAKELGLLEKEGVSSLDIAYCRHPLVFLMEAADDIAYKVIDFEDGCRLKLIDLDKKYSLKVGGVDIEVIIADELVKLFKSKSYSGFDEDRYKKLTNNKSRIAYFRSCLIKILIKECSDVFIREYENIMSGEFDSDLIGHIEEDTKQCLKKMKSLVTEFVYQYRPVLTCEASGFKVVKGLMEAWIESTIICYTCKDFETKSNEKNRALLPRKFRPDNETHAQTLTFDEIYSRVLKILDYVSGMTDTYAVDLYKKMYGIHLD